MQTTIYFGERDAYLISLVDRKAHKERKSRSAVIFSILEEYFERGRPVGEILVHLGLISRADLARALEAQRRSPKKLIGEILLEMGLVDQGALDQAFEIQKGGMPLSKEGTEGEPTSPAD